MNGRAGKNLAVLSAVAIALGFVVRLWLWWISIGSNDALLWQNVGRDVAEKGLVHAYRTQPDCNQPPLQPLWAAAAVKLSGGSDISFARWFKAPLLLADAAATLLLWRIGRRRHGSAFAAIIYALSPIAILAAAHHGNLDPLPATLALLAVALIEENRRFFAAGLVLGLAINVKLIPILLLPALFLSMRTRREALQFAGGLAILALPSVWMLLVAPSAYFARVLSYSGLPSHWGIGHILTEISRNAELAARAVALSDAWFARGKYVMLGAILLLAIYARRHRDESDRYTISAATMCLFLVLAPAFGLQYLIYPAALLAITAPRAALLYFLVGGAFMLLSYRVAWDGTLPILTRFSPAIDPLPGRVFGQLCWATLVFGVFAAGANRRKPSATL